MSAVQPRLAIKRLEPVPGPERGPAGRLGPVPAGQHLRHRRGQVVIPDMPPRHPAGHLERGHVPLEKGLLRAGGIDAVHPLAGIRQPVGEQVAGRHLTGQHDAHRPEIHLRLGTRLLGLRHVPRHAARPPPAAPPRSPPAAAPRTGTRTNTTPASRAHRPAAARSAARYAAACAARPGPPAASRRSAPPPSPAPGRLPLRRLARRRHRRGQRLPHHPPVHPVPARQRPDP